MIFATNKKGFSFIELIVYVAILATGILALSSLFLWSNKANIKAKTNREVLDNANRAIEVMSNEIKEASDIYNPTSIFDFHPGHPGQLSLVTTKYLPTDENTSYIDFFVCGTQLCMKKEKKESQSPVSQPPVAITSDRVKVSNLIFRKIATSDTSTSVQIELKIEYINPGDKPEYQSSIETTTTISLRNY